MATNNHTTTFWHFLENYSIEIPIIQRDFAQGRIGKENLRKNFLNDLKEALDKSKEMKLDFVYGSTENGKLYPLDGQQRLTTLWLLHWYIALRAGKLKEASDYLKNFSYETRVSSRNFCEEMCKPENFKNYNLKNTVVGFIINQTWFYSAWKQDPTIQSMLRMLGGSKQNNNNIDDGIEKVFDYSSCIQSGNFTEGFNRSDYCKPFIDYYNILTSEKCPIVFYYLPKDFGNSDDLYVKMNARGEQLTSFENFKADLIGYIKKQAEKDKRWDALLDSHEGFPIKMDTSWTDIFWKYKSKGTSDGRMTNHIDEIYFAFINRFFWNELFIAKDETAQTFILDIGDGDENSTKENDNISYKYLNDSDNKNDYDTKIAYEGLDSYRYYEGTIPLSFFQKLTKVLNEYLKYSENNSLPGCSWDTSFRFIPQYVVENSNNIEISNNANEKTLKFTTLNQVQRIVFFAVSKYFSDFGTDQNNEISLKQWMRVVWNLVSGEDQNGRPQIRSTQAMRTAMKFISELNSHDVYSSLSNYELQRLGDSDFYDRCKEEIDKAKQILSGASRTDRKSWEEIIMEAENYAFFKGAIRFMFTNDKGDVDWNNFDTKWENSQKYFDQNGVKDDNKVLLTKSLIIQCDNWSEQLYDKQIFKSNANTWRWILTANNWTAPIHNILMGRDISATKENNNEMVKKYVTPILDKLPFDYLINIVPDGRFHWLGERLCFYKPYGRDMATLDWENWYRNKILSSLLNSNTITTDARMKNSDFLWGWNINFSYEDRFFQWWGNPNKKELDVYLMEENWINYKKRRNPTNDKGTDEDNYFCFRVDASTTPATFALMLKELITQAEADKQTL